MAWTWNKRAIRHNTSQNDSGPHIATDAGTPPTDRPLFAVVIGRGDANAPTSFTANGVTWSLIGGAGFSSAVWIGAYIALSGSSPTSADPSASWASSRTGTHIVTFDLDVDGLVWVGSDPLRYIRKQSTGPDVYIASGSGSGTGLTLTNRLAAALADGSRPFAVFEHAADEATTFRTNWTELDDGNFNTPNSGAEIQARLDAFERTISATWAGNVAGRAIAFEIVPPRNGSIAGSLPLPTAVLTAEASVETSLAGILPVPTAALEGATGVEGVLAATLPLPTSELAGEIGVEAVLGGVLPAPIADLDADVAVEGALAGTLPAVTGDLDAESLVEATLNGQLPLPHAALTGTVEGGSSGTLAGVLPMPSASLAGEVLVRGQAAAMLPAPVAALAAEVVAAGALAGTLPMPTANLVVEVDIEGQLAATLPALSSSLAGAVEVGATVDGVLPGLIAQLVGHTFVPVPVEIAVGHPRVRWDVALETRWAVDVRERWEMEVAR